MYCLIIHFALSLQGYDSVWGKHMPKYSKGAWIPIILAVRDRKGFGEPLKDIACAVKETKTWYVVPELILPPVVISAKSCVYSENDYQGSGCNLGCLSLICKSMRSRLAGLRISKRKNLISLLHYDWGVPGYFSVKIRLNKGVYGWVIRPSFL